jgi:hypothetical protein
MSVQCAKEPYRPLRRSNRDRALGVSMWSPKARCRSTYSTRVNNVFLSLSSLAVGNRQTGHLQGQLEWNADA